MIWLLKLLGKVPFLRYHAFPYTSYRGGYNRGCVGDYERGKIHALTLDRYVLWRQVQTLNAYPVQITRIEPDLAVRGTALVKRLGEVEVPVVDQPCLPQGTWLSQMTDMKKGFRVFAHPLGDEPRPTYMQSAHDEVRDTLIRNPELRSKK